MNFQEIREKVFADWKVSKKIEEIQILLSSQQIAQLDNYDLILIYYYYYIE